MYLNDNELSELCKIAVTGAIEAGHIINKYKKEGFKSYKKEAGTSLASTVLTEVDIHCQNLILEVIGKSIIKYDLGLLTEESEDNNSRLVKDYFWCIDPLDGTKSFIDSKFGYSVSISLVSKDGDPIIGVVYDPVSNNLYSGIKGKGVFKNYKAWFPKLTRNRSNYKIIIDPSFNKTKKDMLEFINYGGAVLNAIMVLEGIGDCYLKLPKKEKGGGSIWDFSSTSLFFTELGAIATDFYGNKLNLNNPETTFMNKQGVIYTLNKNIKKTVTELFL